MNPQNWFKMKLLKCKDSDNFFFFRNAAPATSRPVRAASQSQQYVFPVDPFEFIPVDDDSD